MQLLRCTERLPGHCTLVAKVFWVVAWVLLCSC